MALSSVRSSRSNRNKYDYVESRLDTGASVTKLMKQEKAKNYSRLIRWICLLTILAKKPDELFKRMRTKTLANFLIEEV